MKWTSVLRCAPTETDATGVMARKPASFVHSFVLVSILHALLLDNVTAEAASEANLRLSDEPNLHKQRSGKS